MAELTPEQDAFLRQRMPEAYTPVREPVVYVRDWLSIKRMINAAGMKVWPRPPGSGLMMSVLGLTRVVMFHMISSMS